MDSKLGQAINVSLRSCVRNDSARGRALKLQFVKLTEVRCSRLVIQTGKLRRLGHSVTCKLASSFKSWMDGGRDVRLKQDAKWSVVREDIGERSVSLQKAPGVGDA